MNGDDDDSISPDTLDGLDTVRERVEDQIFAEVQSHPHLDAEALEIITMYIVGSLGAGKGRKGSDLDLIITVRYSGEIADDTQFEWQDYLESDIEPTLKKNRSVLADPLPSYIGYVDPKIADGIDSNMFIQQMSQHGGYTRVYDLYDAAFVSADRF